MEIQAFQNPPERRKFEYETTQVALSLFRAKTKTKTAIAIAIAIVIAISQNLTFSNILKTKINSQIPREKEKKN